MLYRFYKKFTLQVWCDQIVVNVIMRWKGGLDRTRVWSQLFFLPLFFLCGGSFTFFLYYFLFLLPFFFFFFFFFFFVSLSLSWEKHPAEAILPFVAVKRWKINWLTLFPPMRHCWIENLALSTVNEQKIKRWKALGTIRLETKSRRILPLT